MANNNKLKRFLCLALVCLMLTPIISFATTDNSDDTDITSDTGTDTQGDNTQAEGDANFVQGLLSTANQDNIDKEKVQEIKDTLSLSSQDRARLAKEAGVVTTSKEDIEGHSYVCSSGGYELYLKQDTLSILVREQKSGAIIRSTLTGEEAVARGYTQTMYDTVTTGFYMIPIKYDDTGLRFGDYTPGIITSIRTATLKYNTRNDGFDVDISFATEGLELTLKVTLDEKGLHYEIPADSRKETKKEFLFGEIHVFPLLGFSDRGEREGYMILPDGNGIIVEYADFFQDGVPKYKSSFSKKVYGKDLCIDSEGLSATGVEGTGGSNNSAEEVLFPYFGTVFEDTKIAMIGFIEEGEENAYIEGNLNGYNRCFENYTTPKFIYRDVYNEPTDSVGNTIRKTATGIYFTDDIKVTYLFTSGEEASYSGLANSLREYLLEIGVIVKDEDTEFNVRLDFMGVDKEKFLVFKKNVVATTADNIKEIVEDLEELGVENIVAIYEGWQNNGVNNTPIYEFDADSDVGGNKAIISLYEELQEKSIDLYLMQDMLWINTSMSSSVFSSVNKFNRKTFESVNDFAEVFDTYRMLFPNKSAEYIEELADDFNDSGIKAMGISGISDMLFVYTKNSEQFSRGSSMKYYEDALTNVKEKGVDVVLKQPYMYLWKYTDSYLDMPLGSSMYVYTSQDIPFLSSVLRGNINVYAEYVNFEANSTEYFLKIIETGVCPSFILTYESPEILQYTDSNWIYTSEYKKYREMIAEYYNNIKAVYDKTDDAYIVRHERTDSNVGITTYSNGVIVYTNFSEEAVTVDGITIEALSYKVGESK